jgi:hypothetical protein
LNGDVAFPRSHAKMNYLKYMPKSAVTKEEIRVDPIINHGFSLLMLFHTIDPNTLSWGDFPPWSAKFSSPCGRRAEEKKMWKALKESVFKSTFMKRPMMLSLFWAKWIQAWLLACKRVLEGTSFT